MSIVNVPTGEVRIRKTDGKRFRIMEWKYQFDNDTWGLIKEFMGFIDFDKILTSEDFCKFTRRLTHNIGYYIEQIPMKSYRYTDSYRYTISGKRIELKPKEFNSEFISIFEYKIVDLRFEMYNPNYTESDYAKNCYSLISQELREFKSLRLNPSKLKEEEEDHPFFIKDFIRGKPILKRNEGFLRKKYCN